MTNTDRLKRQLQKIYVLTNLQRAARLGLRATWLGAAGMMLGWGVNALWGWLPNPLSWILIGLIFALFPFGAFLARLTRPSKWIGKIDESLGLREQLTTAWEIAARSGRGTTAGNASTAQAGQDGTVGDLLVADALNILPQVRSRALQPGLFHEIDLAAAMILTVLSCALLASLLFKPQPATAQQPQTIPLTALTPAPDQQQAPQSGQQPAQSGQQSGAGGQGQQGQAGNDRGGSTGGQSTGNSTGSSGDASNPDMNALSDALSQMGSELSKQAGTYSLGQSLKNMDLNGAAKALEDLGNNLNNLSPESQNNLSQAMQDGADALANSAGAGEQSLSNDLGNAASALSGANQDANGALGQVANDLRQLAQGMQASQGKGSSAGSGTSSGTGNPEPLSRLPNENGDFSLPVDGSPQSGLLSPSQPDSTGTDTASGSLDSTYQAGGNVSQAPVLPNSFSWKWRNVVSQYFQR